MTKNAYQVEGKFQMGRAQQDFRLEIVAKDEAAAKELAYTDLGSRHHATRREIKITGVKKLTGDAISSIAAKKLK